MKAAYRADKKQARDDRQEARARSDTSVSAEVLEACHTHKGPDLRVSSTHSLPGVGSTPLAPATEFRTRSPVHSGSADWKDAALKYLEYLERGRQDNTPNEVERSMYF